METTDILNQVTVIFKKILKKEALQLNMETTANDVDEWDSLNHTVLISETQKHFDVKFKLKEVMQFKNVGDMCTLIHQRLKEKQ